MGGGHILSPQQTNNPGKFGDIGVFSAGGRTTDEDFQEQIAAVKASPRPGATDDQDAIPRHLTVR